MKSKKLWQSLLLGLMMLLMAVCFMSFVACDYGEETNDSKEEWTYDSVYAQAQSLGYEGTLEEFIALISGKDGADGVGVTNAYVNKNGNLIVVLTNGNEIDCGKVKGADGQDGQNGQDGQDGKEGIGIESIEKVAEEGLIDIYQIKYTDGSSSVFTVTNGQDGATGNDGQNGVSITDASINAEGELLLTFSDTEEPLNLGKVVGQDGVNGKDGISIKAASIDEEGNLILTFTDDSTFTVGKVMGKDGIDGKDGVGIAGVKIENGELIISYTEGAPTNLGSIVGTGIRDISLADYELTIKLTDGTIFELGNIRGEKGEAGKSAFELYKEHFGYDGTEEQWLLELVSGELTAPQANFTFQKAAEGNGYILSGYKGNLTEIEIPALYEGEPVIEIGERVFAGERDIESVEFPNSLKKIGAYSFSDCIKLEEVVLPDGMQSIGDFAFLNCTALQTIVLPDSIMLIPSGTFGGCGNAVVYTNLSRRPLNWEFDNPVIYNFGGSYGTLENGLKWADIKSGEVIITGYCGNGVYIEIPEQIDGKSIIYATGDLGSEPKIIAIPESMNETSVRFTGQHLIKLFAGDENYNYDVDNYAGEYGITEEGIVWAKRKDNTVAICDYWGTDSIITIPESFVGLPVTDIVERFFATNSINLIFETPMTLENIYVSGWSGDSRCVILTQSQRFQATNGVFIIIDDYAGEYGITDDGFVWAKKSDGTACIIDYFGSLKDVVIPVSVSGRAEYAVNEMVGGIFNGYGIYNGNISSLCIPEEILYFNRGSDWASLRYVDTVYIEATSKPTGWSDFWEQNSGAARIVWNYGGEHGQTADGFVWVKKNDGTASILAYKGWNKQIKIPAYIPDNGYIVNEIANRALNNNMDLETITIPSSIEMIGDSAFFVGSSCVIFVEEEFKPNGWSDQWYEGSPYIVWGSNGTRGETEDGFIWIAKDNNEAAIIGYNGRKTEVSFPETIEGYTVTEIADGAFIYGNLYIIPKNVTLLEISNNSVTLVTENAAIPSGWNIASEYVVTVENYSGEYGKENGLLWIGRKDDTACIVLNDVSSLLEKLTVPTEVSAYTVTEIRGRFSNNFQGEIMIPSTVTTIPGNVLNEAYNAIIYTDASEVPGWGIGNLRIVLNYGGKNGTYNNFVWAMRKNGTVCIVLYKGTETDIVIPSQIEGHIVEEILPRAFDVNDVSNRMESLTIPESVQTIKSLYLNGQVVVFAEAATQPQGWSLDAWNARFVWNYSGESGTYNNFVWATRKDGTTCIALYTGWATDIVIPSQIEGHAVQEILSQAFGIHDTLNRMKSLTIPESIQKIESLMCGQAVIFAETPSQPQGWSVYFDKVVWNYGGERGVTDEGLLWASLRDGNIAIYGVSSEDEGTRIVIPTTIEGKAVTKIISKAFWNAGAVTEIVIPSSVISIETNAFQGSQIMKIYAYASSQPEGWLDGWNANYNGIIEVVWGYTGE